MCPKTNRLATARRWSIGLKTGGQSATRLKTSCQDRVVENKFFDNFFRFRVNFSTLTRDARFWQKLVKTKFVFWRLTFLFTFLLFLSFLSFPFVSSPGSIFFHSQTYRSLKSLQGRLLGVAESSAKFSSEQEFQKNKNACIGETLAWMKYQHALLCYGSELIANVTSSYHNKLCYYTSFWKVNVHISSILFGSLEVARLKRDLLLLTAKLRYQ